MAIYLIDKIKPKNNGTFPMVDAADVEMPDGSRLSDFKGGVTSVNGQTGDVIVPAGANGKDGVSPTVSVATITGGHRVTITDATGTKTFDVMDGEDGQGASITVDSALSTTSTNPIQNKAVAQRFTQLEEAFSESIENVAENIPSDKHIKELIDAYLSEALGGDY